MRRIKKHRARTANDFQRHLAALEFLARTHPKAAKAIVTFTERAASHVRRCTTGA